MSDKKEELPVNLVSTKQLPDGNTEIMVKEYWYNQLWPVFSKIIINQNYDILAYVDVRMIPEPKEVDVKYGRWFGIQEFHPEMIGDFIFEVNWIGGEKYKKIGGWYGSIWKRISSENMYEFNLSASAYAAITAASGIRRGLGLHQNWYRIENGKITTNVGLMNPGLTYTYLYDTRPSEPSEMIKAHVNWQKERDAQKLKNADKGLKCITNAVQKNLNIFKEK